RSRSRAWFASTLSRPPSRLRLVLKSRLRETNSLVQTKRPPIQGRPFNGRPFGVCWNSMNFSLELTIFPHSLSSDHELYAPQMMETASIGRSLPLLKFVVVQRML